MASKKDKGKNKEKEEVPSNVYMVGGRGVEGEALSGMEVMDCRSGVVQEFVPSTPMPEARWGAGATSWGGKIWVFGGNNGHILSSAAVFDPQMAEWTPIPNMSNRRTNHCATAVGKRIYICGGFGGDHGADVPLDSAERYDPALNEWEVIAPMSAKRFNAASVCSGPLLFIFGGATDKPEPLRTVECFDARDNGVDWRSFPEMTEKRQGHGATIIQGMPIVCGGHDGATCLSSVEYLSPTGRAWLDGGRDGQWQESASMSIPRYGLVACCAMGPDRGIKVFVFGGHNGSDRVKTVECRGWDLDSAASQAWENVPKVEKAEGKRMDVRSGSAYAVLEVSPEVEKRNAERIEAAARAASK